MIEALTKQQTVEQIVKEVNKLRKTDQILYHKEIKIRRLMGENKPIVRAKGVPPLSLDEINEIKHLSRNKRA